MPGLLIEGRQWILCTSRCANVIHSSWPKLSAYGSVLTVPSLKELKDNVSYSPYEINRKMRTKVDCVGDEKQKANECSCSLM